MLIVPAIDIFGNQCVRLAEGDEKQNDDRGGENGEDDQRGEHWLFSETKSGGFSVRMAFARVPGFSGNRTSRA